ncbi:MAG TPA: ABC transporter ATP-binding protein [Candidatus Dormibacteraeota bacterium]|jgi:branched-chain amino acid transport system ATP-binding protein|nr:ABC transporter ATP-binding protein [Candidatus Dormibacteraeota bacterium]
MALLEIRGVGKRFGGVQALQDVSATVHRGEIVGLIGPNGAGKTTLFNCISGVESPDAGRITYDGRDLAGMSPHGRARLGIARTFQNLQLFGSMTVLENCMVAFDAFARRGMVGDALRMPWARFEERRARERAQAMLHFLDIERVAGLRAQDLPTGVQRRVELARALCLRPALLLLDEPAAGLDADETAELAGFLRSARDRLEVSMLLVDHDMSLVMRVCDHITVLDFGRVIASGDAPAIRSDPVVITAYLGEAA